VVEIGQPGNEREELGECEECGLQTAAYLEVLECGSGDVFEFLE